MQNTPSLFTASHSTLTTTVDLAKIAAMSKRNLGGGWWITASTPFVVCDQVGEQIHAAWLSFQGKFNPQTAR